MFFFSGSFNIFSVVSEILLTCIAINLVPPLNYRQRDNPDMCKCIAAANCYERT